MGAGASTGCNSANAIETAKLAKQMSKDGAKQMTKQVSQTIQSLQPKAIEVAQITKHGANQLTKQVTQTIQSLQSKPQPYQLHIIAIARDATTGLLGIGLNDENFVLEPGPLATAAGLQTYDQVVRLDDTTLGVRKLADVMAEVVKKEIHVFTVHRYEKGRIRLSTGTPQASFRGRAAVHPPPSAVAAPATTPGAAAPAAAPAAVAAEAPASAAAGVGAPAVFTVDEPPSGSAAASLMAAAPAAAAVAAAALRPITNRVRLSGASKAEVAPDPTAPVEPIVAVAPLAPMAPLPPIMAAA